MRLARQVSQDGYQFKIALLFPETFSTPQARKMLQLFGFFPERISRGSNNNF